MPFDFQAYETKCAAMNPEELQREWQHYTRLISSASTSTAVSGLALPLTMGVSLIGVGMAAPAIHNARKKRAIIERHLQKHGTTHNTRKRDVMGSMALSGTIGVVTLGVGSMGADAAVTAGAEHGISAIVENEMAIKVATHAALDGAGLAIEHGLHGHVQEKDAHKAFKAAGTFQAVADAKAREAGYAAQPYGYPYAPQGYGAAGSSTGQPQAYVMSFGGQMPAPPPYSAPGVPVTLADTKSPAVAPQLLSQAYGTGSSGYPVQQQQQPHMYGDQSRQASISGYSYPAAAPREQPAPSYPQDAPYPRRDTYPSISYDHPPQASTPASYPYALSGVVASREFQPSPAQYVTSPPPVENQGQAWQPQQYGSQPTAQQAVYEPQTPAQNPGNSVYDMAAMKHSLPEPAQTPGPNQNQGQTPKEQQPAPHQEPQQPQAPQEQQQVQQDWHQQQQQQQQQYQQQYHNATAPAAWSGTQVQNDTPSHTTPQEPVVVVPSETPVLHAPRPAAPHNPAAALTDYVTHPTPAPEPAAPYETPAPQQAETQAPQPPVQQHYQPTSDPVSQAQAQRYSQPYAQQQYPQTLPYPAYSTPPAPTYPAAVPPPPPPPQRAMSSYQPASYPPAPTYQPAATSHISSPTQAQSYTSPPYQASPTNTASPAGYPPPVSHAAPAPAVQTYPAYTSTPPYTPTPSSLPQSSPPHQQQPRTFQAPPKQYEYQPYSQPQQQQQPAYDPYAAIPLAPLTPQSTYPEQQPEQQQQQVAQSYPQQTPQAYPQQPPPSQAVQPYPHHQQPQTQNPQVNQHQPQQAAPPYPQQPPQQQPQQPQSYPYHAVSPPPQQQTPQSYPHYATSPPLHQTYTPTPPPSGPQGYSAPADQQQKWSGQAQWPAQVPGTYTPVATPGTGQGVQYVSQGQGQGQGGYFPHA